MLGINDKKDSDPSEVSISNMDKEEVKNEIMVSPRAMVKREQVQQQTTSGQFHSKEPSSINVQEIHLEEDNNLRRTTMNP